MTGGGSGGHITPILAVASQLKQLNAVPEVIYIGQRGDKVASLMEGNKLIDSSYYISAGKLRRYHGDGIKQLLDFKTIALNIRDIFKTAAGLFQAWRLLGKLKPDAIFIKGGFVGVPVGLAAAMRKIPFITHDSDSTPGLANRIIARWAFLHAVALPKQVYTYDPKKTISVGVPISDQFKPVGETEMREAKLKIGIPVDCRAILLTGGGLGAQTLNEAMLVSANQLLTQFKDLYIIMLVGHKHSLAVTRTLGDFPKDLQKRVIVKDFVNDLYNYSAAAEFIIARAGATAIAEFAAQRKACIIVPHPGLTGGHQLKNASILEKRQAALVLHNDSLIYKPEALLAPIKQLLDNPALISKLSGGLAKLAKTDSAEQLAVLITRAAAR